MRRILLGLVIGTFSMNGEGSGQDPMLEREATDQLEKRGVVIERGMAVVRSPDAKTIQALGLLQHVRLVGIEISNLESNHMAECLGHLGALQNLKALSLDAVHLTNKDLKKIASFTQLEGLALFSPSITDANIGQLHALKGMKNLRWLRIVHGKVAQEALMDLKRELAPLTNLYFEKDMTLHPLPITPKDDGLVKLQKEKLNAAIAEINTAYREFRGKVRFLTPECTFCERMKNAITELNDPKLTMNVANELVEFMDRAHRDTGESQKGSAIYQRTRYYYLDAQMLQMRLKKQLDAK